MSQIKYIETIFKFYNKKLFAGKLPDVIISFNRDSRMSGEFLPNKWQNKDEKPIHELSINPEFFQPYDIEFHQTIVHEMCHLYQHEFGQPGKSGYHNKEFSGIMKDVGLICSDSGTPGGLPTGRRMADYPEVDGLFVKAFQKLQESRFKILEQPIKKEKIKKGSGNRVKYSCQCGNNIWGKSGLKIQCKICKSDFERGKIYEY